MNNFGVLRNAETLEWLGFAPIYDSGSCLGYDKTASQIRGGKNIVCKPFKNHHEEQLKLVSSFDWLNFDSLADVGELIQKNLTCDGAEEYIDQGRIDAITESIEQRIQTLKELAMGRNERQANSMDDDVQENVAETYGPKMSL